MADYGDNWGLEYGGGTVPVIVEWNEEEKAVFYRVYRSDDGTADSFTLLDTALPGLQYMDTSIDAGVDKFYEVRPVDEDVEEMTTQVPFSVYSVIEAEYCKIFGTVKDLNGRPEADTEVRFELRREDSPQVFSNSIISNTIKTMSTNELGAFEMYLLRNLTIQMYVPSARFQLLFAVPDEVSKEFSLLEGTFGFATDRENPF